MGALLGADDIPAAEDGPAAEEMLATAEGALAAAEDERATDAFCLFESLPDEDAAVRFEAASPAACGGGATPTDGAATGGAGTDGAPVSGTTNTSPQVT